jgi:hypothetical protein
MATKSEVVRSLKKQGLVDDPESWMKLAAMIACVTKKMREEGKSLDTAVYDCYMEVK